MCCLAIPHVIIQITWIVTIIIRRPTNIKVHYQNQYHQPLTLMFWFLMKLRVYHQSTVKDGHCAQSNSLSPVFTLEFWILLLLKTSYLLTLWVSKQVHWSQKLKSAVRDIKVYLKTLVSTFNFNTEGHKLNYCIQTSYLSILWVLRQLYWG